MEYIPEVDSDDAPSTSDPAPHLHNKTETSFRKSTSLRSRAEGGFWVLAAAAVLYYGDGGRSTFTVLRQDERIHRRILLASILSFAVNACIFLYVQFWLGRRKGVKAVEKAAPWALPAGTVAGGMGVLLGMISIWPVWHVFTIPITAVLFMGSMMGFMFLPELGPYLGPAAPRTSISAHRRKHE